MALMEKEIRLCEFGQAGVLTCRAHLLALDFSKWRAGGVEAIASTRTTEPFQGP